MTAAAVFENVEKRYRSGPWDRTGVPAVRGVSLTIPTGTVFGLLGPNRAGKTTLIKMLLTLAKPTAGTITRLGQPLRARQTLSRVGYMHENHAFPRYLSAREVLNFYGGLSGTPPERLATHAEELLQKVGLSDRAAEPIHRFSKGMVQRLGLAQALINDPDLLILDEPTEGLDIHGRQLLREVIHERRAAGKTVLLVTHVLPEVEELCDELAVVVAGKLAFQGRMTDLLGASPRDPSGRNLEAALRTIYDRGTQE